MASRGNGVIRFRCTGSIKPAWQRCSIATQPPGSADTSRVFWPYFSMMYSAMWPTWVVLVLPVRPKTKSAFGPKVIVGIPCLDAGWNLFGCLGLPDWSDIHNDVVCINGWRANVPLTVDQLDSLT